MNDNSSRNEIDLDQAALFYHQHPSPGKIAIQATTPLDNQRDLALAYSPGVAAPCRAIENDPQTAHDYTARGNLVAVISNGTAVLGLGAIGALASKPVMEGKAVLFKKFADIDVFDIEVEERDPQKFIDVVAALEPTFGGINLEDIKAPECFEIEAALKERMKIPVFHDDQHGTAIIVAAAVINGLELAHKEISDVKIVASGAGAASLACLNQLVAMGARRENIWVSDVNGVIYEGREGTDRWAAAYAQKTEFRTLGEIIKDADVFLGLSAGGVLKADMVKEMGKSPLILALANPHPEILPQEAMAVRDDCIICTGRSDFPNQVNNVLCFPYIFRGALDAGATTINEEMKRAAVLAIAKLAKEEPSEAAAKAYGGKIGVFGPDYLIPSPFDQRLILRIAPSVAKAAMDSGVAAHPILDFEAYLEKLNRFVFRSGFIMKPVIEQAAAAPSRVIYADGEDERVLRAAQVVLEEGLAIPILIGRPEVIEQRCERFGLRVRPGVDFEIINPANDPRYRDYVDFLIQRVGRRGVSPETARYLVRANNTVIGAIAVVRGDADGLICGLDGRYHRHLHHIDTIIGKGAGVRGLSALSLLIMQNGAYFLTDTHVTVEPSTEEIAEMTILAARHIRRFGLEPRAALLASSNFGSNDQALSMTMRVACQILRRDSPELIVDGEMNGEAALSEEFRNHAMPLTTLKGETNLLVFPSLASANIGMNLMKMAGNALQVGPILLGTDRPAHILTTSVTSRGVVNMTALTVAETSAND